MYAHDFRKVDTHPLFHGFVERCSRLIATLVVIALASTSLSQEPDFKLEREVSLDNVIGGAVEVGLGKLAVGKSGLVEIKAVNESSRDIDIKKVVLGCSCVNVKTNASRIAPNEELVVSVLLKVPLLSSSIEQVQSIRVECTDRDPIQLLLKFELDGVCSFKNASETLVVRPKGDVIEFYVPLTVSEDIDRRKFVFSGDGELRGAKGEFWKKDGLARFTMASPNVPSFSKVGRLLIENTETKQKVSIPCFLSLEEDVSVHPKTLVFSKQDGMYAATALVRASHDLIHNSPERIEFSIGISIDSIKSTVRSTSIGNGITKVRVELKESELEDFFKKARDSDSPKAKWQIGWPGGIAEPESIVLFPKGALK